MHFILHSASVTNPFFFFYWFRLPSKTSRKELNEGFSCVKLWMSTDDYSSLFFELFNEFKLFSLSFSALYFSCCSYTFSQLQSKIIETVGTDQEVIFSWNITVLAEFWLKPFVLCCYSDVFPLSFVFSLLLTPLQWNKPVMCNFFLSWINIILIPELFSPSYCGVGM